MKFAYVHLLAMVPLLLAAAWWLWRDSAKRAERKLAAFAPPSRLPAMLRSVDFRAKRRKFLVFSAALVLLAVVAARPLWGPRKADKPQEGAEFFIVLDVSKSMWVRDVAPSRLDAVKTSLDGWLKTRSGDRIGLILMAGDAFIQAPLTNDYTALREVLAQSGPKALSLGGTNLSEAIKVAGQALEASEVKNKAIVIVSDGENTEGHVLADVRKAHLEQRIRFFTVGVGTADGGQVPSREVPADFSGPLKEVVRDEFGLVVTSKLDERNLRAIAAAGGGRYFGYHPEGDTWDMLYQQALSTLAMRSAVFRLEDYVELFQIPLLAAILLLLAEAGISTRLRNPPKPKSVVTLPDPSPGPTATVMETKNIAPLAILVFAVLCGNGVGKEAMPVMERAGVLVREGKPEEAAAMLLEETRKRPDDLYLMYNYGVAAYASKQYKEAGDAFSEATLSRDEKLRAKALAQLGNTHFRIGEEVSKSWSKAGVLVAWERAVEYYRSADEEDSTKMTRRNLEVATSRLEKLLLELAANAVKEADKLEEAADKAQSEQAKAQNLGAQVQQLTRATEHLEKVAQLRPENAEAGKERDKVAERLSGKLTEQARNLRDRAEKVAEGKNQRQEREKLQVLASQAYEKARELTPDNKPLSEEHDAFKKDVADRMTETAQELADQAMARISDELKSTDLRKKEEDLKKALNQTQKALGFDEANPRAQALQEKVMSELQDTYLDLARLAMITGERNEERRNFQGAVENFRGAMQSFQKALELDPANAEAAAGAEEVQEKLARNMTEVGKKEMAQVGAAPPEPKKGQPAPESDPVSRLRQDIGHLEKAAQNFAQAEALAPGENEAAALQQEANEKLSGLRTELDLAQANQPRQDQGVGENAESGMTAEVTDQVQEDTEGEPQPGVPGMKPVAPMMSFSETRGASARESEFRELIQKKKIRDW